MTPAAEPGLGLSRIKGVKEGLSRPSQMAGGMEEIEYGDGCSETGVVDPPKASSAVAEPDDEWSGVYPLTGGLQLQGRDEVINGAQHRHQSASQQLGDTLSRPGDPSTEAGQNADFYLPPLNGTHWGLRRRTKGHHHPIGPNGSRQGR